MDDPEYTPKTYTFPLMLTIEATGFDEAFQIADKVAEGLGTEGENVYAAYDDETDNTGQRVYYLPPKGMSNQEWDCNDS